MRLFFHVLELLANILALVGRPQIVRLHEEEAKPNGDNVHNQPRNKDAPKRPGGHAERSINCSAALVRCLVALRKTNNNRPDTEPGK